MTTQQTWAAFVGDLNLSLVRTLGEDSAATDVSREIRQGRGFVVVPAVPFTPAIFAGEAVGDFVRRGVPEFFNAMARAAGNGEFSFEDFVGERETCGSAQAITQAAAGQIPDELKSSFCQKQGEGGRQLHTALSRMAAAVIDSAFAGRLIDGRVCLGAEQAARYWEAMRDAAAVLDSFQVVRTIEQERLTGIAATKDFLKKLPDKVAEATGDVLGRAGAIAGNAIGKGAGATLKGFFEEANILTLAAVLGGGYYVATRGVPF